MRWVTHGLCFTRGRLEAQRGQGTCPGHTAGERQSRDASPGSPPAVSAVTTEHRLTGSTGEAPAWPQETGPATEGASLPSSSRSHPASLSRDLPSRPPPNLATAPPLLGTSRRCAGLAVGWGVLRHWVCGFLGHKSPWSHRARSSEESQFSGATAKGLPHPCPQGE